MLGHLEDLSVADIIQIVFLSRRTGVLEVSDKRGKSAILFDKGLIVNASSPRDPDLATHLRSAYLGEDAQPFLKMKEKEGVPAGLAAVELGLMSQLDLQKAVTERLFGIIKPLLTSREGEFNFILAESIPVQDIEYDPVSVFGEPGLNPQRILAVTGEKLKPLRGLEETVRAEKALRRSAASRPAAPLDLNFAPASSLPLTSSKQDEGETGRVGDTDRLEDPFDTDPGAGGSEVQQDSLEALLESEPAGESFDRKEEMRFRVGSASSIVAERLEDEERRILVVEQDPMVRVAVRRAFGKEGVNTTQFATAEEAVRAIHENAQKKAFFVTILDIEAEKAISVLQFIKRTNRRLPVVAVYSEGAASMRRVFADAGADVFARRPSAEALRGPGAPKEMEAFCRELVDLSEKAQVSWVQLSTSLGGGAQIGEEFYDMSQREKAGRSFGLLKQLITELSEPGDVEQIVQTILRLSAEYTDRSVLFMLNGEAFVALGARGDSGDLVPITERVRQLRIPFAERSILQQVAQTRKPHRGKLRREAANQRLIDTLGNLVPTETVVLPILNDEEVVGVLYGDNAENRSPIGSTSGLEIFLSQAGFALQSAVAGSSK